MRRRMIPIVLAALAVLATAFSVGARSLTQGALTQLPGTAGCLSDKGGGSCVDLKAPLNHPAGLVVSPEGTNAYAVAVGDLLEFSRNTSSGALSELPGLDRCVSVSGTNGKCRLGVAVNRLRSLAVSADAKNVYALSNSGAVAIFSRDPSTGVLTQLSGTAGCVSKDGNGGLCAVGRALPGAQIVTVTPDDKNVYVAAHKGPNQNQAVALFSRDATTGALTQLTGTAGCVSDGGRDGCTAGVAFKKVWSVSVSPDGKNVYVASSVAVAAFSRDPSTGVLTQLSGTDACVSETGFGGLCADGRGLVEPRHVVFSPDGEYVYVATAGTFGYSGGGVAAFSRNATTGALTQLAGADGCVTMDGDGGECATAFHFGGGFAIAVDPSGANLYLTGFNTTIFSRNAMTGALSQLPGAEGCVTTDGSGGACTTGSPSNTHVGGFGGPALTVSPDELNLYLTNNLGAGAIGVYARH